MTMIITLSSWFGINILRQIGIIVPNGIVVFITSYYYLQKLLDAWTPRLCSENTFVDRLSREFDRPVFIEVGDFIHRLGDRHVE